MKNDRIERAHGAPGHEAGHATDTKFEGQGSSSAARWIERLGRLGYSSKGVVYTLVGLLSARAVAGTAQATTGIEGLFHQIVLAPLGQLLLASIALGLAGYGVWRLTQAILDTEDRGLNAGGLLARGASAVIGVSYLGLAASAVGLIIGTVHDRVASALGWADWLLSQPLGRWALGIVGLVVIGYGLYELYRAYNASFRPHLDLDELEDRQREWLTRLGRVGYSARGITFSIVGGFLLLAAVEAQAREARGLGASLATVARQPFGSWLLAALATGLIAYGLFTIVEARYRLMLPG